MPEKSHAFLYKPLCLAEGLFISQKRGASRPLSAQYLYAGDEIRFEGDQALGAFDLLVLQGIAALAFDQDLSVNLDPNPQTSMGRALRDGLGLRGKACDRPTLALASTSGRLLKEIGRSAGGGNFASLKSSLDRMSKVTLAVTRDHMLEAGRLVAHTFDPATGRISIAIHPRMAGAINGEHFAVFDMAEVRHLETDAARLIHGRICGWLDQGKSTKIALDTLCRYVWPAPEATEQVHYDTVKRQRQIAKNAVFELISRLKWYPKTYKNMAHEEIMKHISFKSESIIRRGCKNKAADTIFKIHRPPYTENEQHKY
jgi:hypothetical protein